jgi:predicted RNase H-like HicB family nuclease
MEEIPAAISQGETLDEAKVNLRDALQLVLDCREDLLKDGLLFTDH